MILGFFVRVCKHFSPFTWWCVHIFPHILVLLCLHMLLTHVFLAFCTLASNACIFCTSVFRRRYTRLWCMYFMYICFFVQVFLVVNTHASNACISWTLAFMCKYFLSSIYILLMYVIHPHLLFGTSVFCR